MVNYLEIINLINKNDPKGLELLYKEYGQALYGYATNKWQLNEDEAWEVIYKTLETLVLKLPDYTFESASHLNNFVFKVFINFLRQYFRSSRRRIQQDIQYVFIDEEQSSVPLADIEKKAMDDFFKEDSATNEWLIYLNKALKTFKRVDQQLLLLKAQNYTYEEIAQLLNIKNDQLKVKYWRAKNKLIKTIKQLKDENHEQVK